MTTLSPTPSAHLSTFLTFLREARQAYSIAVQEESDANDATQDILHSLELETHSYHDYARLAKALCQVRRKRRDAKDQITRLWPVVEWQETHPEVVKALKRLLGEMRKAEKSTQYRHYTARTDVVSLTINGKELTP